MNGATLKNDTNHINDSDPAVIHTIVLGGTADFKIAVLAMRVLYGYIDGAHFLINCKSKIREARICFNQMLNVMRRLS
jgi:hypothetical protein